MTDDLDLKEGQETLEYHRDLQVGCLSLGQYATT